VSTILGKTYRASGDIDVLAWKNGRVLLIECKDLLFAKTPGEMAEQLSDFRGELKPDGKPDDLLRHLRRIDLISNNLPQLANHLRLPEGLTVEGHLVFKNPVPMQFAWTELGRRIPLHVLENLAL
jgi:hypothetical protein